MSDQFQTMDELVAHFRNRSVEDEDFRARLLANPKDVLEDELDLTIPDGFEVHVHEDTGTSAHFVLPPSGAISDAEMGAVAGGSGWCSPV